MIKHFIVATATTLALTATAYAATLNVVGAAMFESKNIVETAVGTKPDNTWFTTRTEVH